MCSTDLHDELYEMTMTARHSRYFDAIGEALEGVHQTSRTGPGGWVTESDAHAIKRLRAELDEARRHEELTHRQLRDLLGDDDAWQVLLRCITAELALRRLRDDAGCLDEMHLVAVTNLPLAESARDRAEQYFASLSEDYARVCATNNRLQTWVNDLHSQMFINCVYCGHRYGPNPGTPVSMSDILTTHIETCPEHPMSKLKTDNTRLTERIRELEDTLSDWQRSHEGI